MEIGHGTLSYKIVTSLGRLMSIGQWPTYVRSHIVGSQQAETVDLVLHLRSSYTKVRAVSYRAVLLSFLGPHLFLLLLAGILYTLF